MSGLPILIVDDNKFVCTDIATSLDQKRFEIDTAQSGEDAFEFFLKNKHEIVVTDLQMNNDSENGFKLIGKIKAQAPDTAVLVITGYAELQRAIKAMQLGAADFITKPFDVEQVVARINSIAERIELQSKNNELRQALATHYEMVGDSPVMAELKRKIALIAKSGSHVLITGPNGTGKELVARSIQVQSPRANKLFVIVNCAALPENLIEAELFGTTKFAYTGATDKKGKIELADGGTLFLDEIGDMPLAAQAKVLRAIEGHEISRVGSEKTYKYNVRVIAATNKNLPEMIQQNKFREDLFHRLNVAAIQTPSLKERSSDIPGLINHKLTLLGRAQKSNNVLSNEALDFLIRYKWPGNVRELNNVIERMMIYWEEKPWSLVDIKCNLTEIPNSVPVFDTSKTLKAATEDFEREFIQAVLDECKGNKSDASKRLDLQRPYLYEKMKRLGIDSKSE
jgi:two-component system, NtrC family, nitrogen regulation response regulator NtrX